ncbi:hypothetical protein Tco_1547297 [Tanacetum coccineum]
MTPELHRQFEKSSPYDMINKLKSMFEKQARVKRFDLIQTFHAYKQEEGKPVGPYVLKMKGYVEQLERLGYVLPQDISVGFILNGLTSDFARFVRNYNMHNMGKTVGELHALLIKYEKCLPKKATTPQVMAIQGGLPFELEWDPLPNYTIRSSNSFEWHKIIFGMITSMGIRHVKACTIRGRSSTKLGQRLSETWKPNNRCKNSSIPSKPDRAYIWTISGTIRGTRNN